MQSLRMFSRALPKASFRQPALLRSLSSASRFSVCRPTWRPAMKTSYPAFSTSIARMEPAGESDGVLSEKLNSEKALEAETDDPDKLEAVQDFLQSTSWKIQDKEGSHNFVLTREFGNEKIKVELSVHDVQDADEYEDGLDPADEDDALSDEAVYEPARNTINQSGVKGGKVNVLPEDSIAPSDRAEAEGDEENVSDRDDGPAYPLRLNITITKPGKTALQILAIAADGAIEIESLNYFPKESLLETLESQEARNLFAGPPFGNLDPELQMLFETYIAERGIDAQLASFLPEYVDYKEQREYVQWLDNVKNFIDE